MDFQPHQYPSVSERRGHRLAPLETNFSRPNNNYARPTLRPAVANNRPRPHADGQVNERVPLHQPPVKRQSSMTSLRSLFGRDKPARKHPPQSHSKLAEIDEVHHHPTATATATETNPDTTTNNNSHTTVTQTQPETPLSPSFCTTPTSTSTFTPATAAATTTTKPPGKKPSARDLGWKPPPLFQAYPQAVKHGTLPAPTLSADAILRVHAASKSGGSRDEESMGAGLSQQKQENHDVHVARLKKENKEKKHMRSVSETIAKTDWTEKIYVVTTSGYILQYAGEGKHDRLPEKMLLLGPKSVAFASDAIPGKHWVLQVSQDSQPESTTTSAADTPRPLLARLGFHRSYTRRLTQSFLLVFTDPDELSSWLLAVRAQIETRGGKKYVSERVFDDGMEHQLRPKVSARQLVKKDPNRVSSLFLQPQLDVQSEADELSVLGLSRQSSYASNNRRSIISSTTHTDVTAPSTSNHGGSSGGSGGGSGGGGGGGRFYAGSSTEAATQSPALSSPKKRQSMLYMPHPTPQTETPQSSRPPSMVPEPFVRSTSPPAPNFSVPSFSKRFAARSGMTQIPPLQLGNRVNEEELDNNAIPVFPSPPQSPSHSLSSMSRNDLTDPYPPLVSRQSSLARRPLRASNSQDSLVASEQTTQQYQDRKATTTTTTTTNTPTRPPRGSVSTVGSAARPSRPISIVSSGDASLSSEAQLPQSPPTPSSTHAPSSRRDPHRSRTSVLYPTNNSNVTYSPMPNMSRRKSTAALNIPPPVVPPPNCPLPKIPSPADPSGGGDGGGGREGAMSPPPHEKMRIRNRKFSTTTTSSGSTSNTTASSYHPRFSLGLRTSVSSRHMNANVI